MNVLVRKMRGKLSNVLLAVSVAIFAAGCASSGDSGSSSNNAPSSNAPTQTASAAVQNDIDEINKALAANDNNAAKAFEKSYRLGPGDRLRVIVFGEEDLSGEFEVDSVGVVSLPLIQPINTSNMTLAELRTQIENQLKAGYLVEPRVSVEILNYRPFYITGEVGRPGEYPYVAGMNVLKAIAMAGGYTYRANTRRVLLTRADTNSEEEKKPTQQLLILPGDYIRVPERFF